SDVCSSDLAGSKGSSANGGRTTSPIASSGKSIISGRTLSTASLSELASRFASKIASWKRAACLGFSSIYVSSAANPNMGDSGRRSEEHTSELQSRFDLVCRLLLEKKNTNDTE